MKKVLKKMLSVALVVLMLMSVMSLQSFAALDVLRMPTVTELEIISDDADKAIPLSEVDAFYEELFETLEEMTQEYGVEMPSDINELLEQFPYLANLLNFNLSYSNTVEYDYEVTLSNGDTLTVKSDTLRAEYKKIFDVDVDAYITYEDYFEAAENDADTVKVTFKGTVSNRLLDGYVEPKTTTFHKDIDLVSCYVKSITPISDIPTRIYEFCDYYEIDGAKFKVVYADGSSEILQAEKHINEAEVYDSYIGYTLDSKPLYVYEYDDEVLEFSYLDATARVDVEYYEDETPFESVKITDYAFDENIGLTAISYDITWKNGKVKHYDKEFASVNGIVLPYGTLDAVDGFYVNLSPFPYLSFDDEMIDDAGYLFFAVSAGECEDYVKVGVTGSEQIGIITKVIIKLMEIIEMIKDIIGNLLGVVIL